MKQRTSLFLTITILALLLAGCGQAGPGAATTADGQTTDALGMVEIKSGDPIVIGYALTIAGPNAALGLDSQRGVEIAIEDAGGELLGHKIELTGEDTGCTPEGGQSAATKLAANTKIVA